VTPVAGNSTGTIVFIAIAVLIIGAGYYSKIYRPKQQTSDMGTGMMWL